MSNYPDGLLQSDVDRAAGGDEIPCECWYNAATDFMETTDCRVHGGRCQRSETTTVSPEGTDVEF